MKANAIKKLTFLRMMGYEFGWANFAIIEVMSSQRFGHKRVGYLAAAQSFNEETDVILLTTNLLKKEVSARESGSVTSRAVWREVKQLLPAVVNS